VVVILRDASGQDVARWSVSQALPARYVGPSLNARASEVAMESLELAVESIELE
jgi:phage tail-like protein